jgi:predicted Ser/Thr protein kinase
VRPGDVIDDRYELEAIAGRGGMGEVYRARDRVSGATVAIKILRVENDARFAREARMLASLRHPAIVGYLDHGPNWLAMEWLEGEPLSSAIARARLSPLQTVRLLERVAEGLAVAHPLGIVHRDLKPNNIFLVEGNLERPKLLDFGLARPIGETLVTATGVLIGTPSYMSPEQARRGRDVDARSDVFSLGCVAWACLTGASPFAAPDVMTVLMKVMLEELPSLAGIPPALDALIARMLAKSPAGRPNDAGAVLAELRALDLDAHAAEPASGISLREERITFRVIGRRAIDSEEPTLRDDDPTVTVTNVGLALEGASFVAHADGTFVAAMHPSGSAIDRAARAARIALALQKTLGPIPLVVTTDDLEPVDARIMVDPPLRALLSTHFELRDGELLSERTQPAEPTTPFVGRERELAQLRAIRDECIVERTSRVVLITGPAGIGKTRLAREVGGDHVEIHEHEPRAPSGSKLVLVLAREVPAGLSGAEHIRLGELPRRACEKLTTDPEVLARAGGNPLLLEELIRDRHSVVALAHAQARIDALDTSARRVLRAASTLGETFTRDELAPLAGELETWLPVLIDREFLESRGDRVAFRNSLVREAAYAMLPERDRLLAR